MIRLYRRNKALSKNSLLPFTKRGKTQSTFTFLFLLILLLKQNVLKKHVFFPKNREQFIENFRDDDFFSLFLFKT